MTCYIVILGYPLKHSVSPVFQQAAFDCYRLELRYEAWEVAPQKLAEVVDRLRQPENLGANVTVPHKEAVIPLLDGVEAEAAAIGAVNTIVKGAGGLTGHNTDVKGFLRALREEGGFDPSGRGAMVLGAGGVARAAGFALLQAGTATLLIANRTPERAQRLAAELTLLARPGQEVRAIPYEAKRDFLPGLSLLVNATTLGMRHSAGAETSPFLAAELPAGVLVYDLVYNPRETPLLREAKQAGARVLDGLPMLIYQGAYSFEMWTGRAAPIDIMFKAATAALGV